MPSNNVPDVNFVEQVLQAAPNGLDIILMGYLNARLGNPRDKHEADLATTLAYLSLVNMEYHFLPRSQ